MGQINRRAFLKSTSGLLALAAMDMTNFNCASSPQMVYVPSRPPRGANEKVNVAVIGLGGRGFGSHISAYGKQSNSQIVYVCDPDSAFAQKSIDKSRNSNGGTEPQFVQDMRRIFDDKSVDAVSIATCNHWHSLAAIWAMQAGKDVYVEKPLSHNLSEGRRVVQAAQRTGAVVQCGTQMRSNAALIESMAYLRSGALGKVLVSRALCYKSRPSIGKVSGPQQPPSTCDYNLWCGPSPMAPLMRSKLHYDWHWVWDQGNGDIGNQGIHEIDIARWALGTDAAPKSCLCVGGRFGYVDDGQTYNTQVASFDYGTGQPKLVIEVRGLETKPFHSRGVENVVHCEKGIWVSPTYTSAVAYDPDGHVLKQFNGGGDANHFGNFLEVVRSRKMADLHAPAIEGHLSCVPLHMANISNRFGQSMAFSTSRSDYFGSDAEGNEAMSRMVKHLADNKVPVESTFFMMGKRLNFNAETETFRGDDQANRMLTREYRKPFVVPDKV
ncbi:MAG TPA: Gfo/Idh/MocA family oxidoreductase [Tepidisphaeraceae bacterium]|nr:Gfo/Idh/MocA family oxidoreductase [Tepidisphaeraceae bacterium]